MRELPVGVVGVGKLVVELVGWVRSRGVVGGRGCIVAVVVGGRDFGEVVVHIEVAGRLVAEAVVEVAEPVGVVAVG